MEPKYQVLIFDDDIALAEMLREYLILACNAEVTLVHHEDDFWPAIRSGGYDILFLDYQLQTITGLQVLEQLTNDRCPVPTVMMTGQGSEKIAAHAIQNGAFDYLVKGDLSFSLTILPSLIQKAVQLRRLQQAVRDSEAKVHYQAMLLDNVRDALVVWNQHGKITYWNSAAEQVFGRTSAEMLGKTVDTAYFPIFSPPIELPVGFAINGEKMVSERSYAIAPGTRIWISSQISPLFDANHQISGCMDISRDISVAKQEQHELDRSRHLIQQVLEASPNIVYTLNLRNNQINYITPKIEPILGLHVADILHARTPFFFSMVEPKDLPALIHHYNGLNHLRDGEISEVEYRIKLNPKEWRWLKNRETTFARDSNQLLIEIIGVCEDITTRKQAEEKLFLRLYSEKLLSTLSTDLINLSRDHSAETLRDTLKTVSEFIGSDRAMLFLNENGQLFNTVSYIEPGKLEEPHHPKSIELSPWLDETLRGHTIYVIHSLAELEPSTRAEYERLLGASARPAVLLPILYNDKVFGLVIFSTSASVLTWESELDYLILTFGQILLKALIQNQIDRALQESEARYRAIVDEHQTEMICRFGPNLQLSFINETFCRYYDCDREMFADRGFMAFALPEDHPTIQETITALTPTDPAAMVSFRVQMPNGTIRWQEWVIRGISAPDAEPIRPANRPLIEYQAVGRDITERKNMEEQIHITQMRLVQATRLASVGQLAASVAHQISNPLTTIIADGQMLLRTMKPSSLDFESTEAIVQAGWRAQQVISELMKFSQPSDDHRELVYLNETIEKALLLSTAHLHAGGAVLDLKLPDVSPEIHANERQLVDLWVNLLLAPLNLEIGIPTTIHIQASEDANGSITVRFIDDGVHIPDEQLETLFDPQLIPAGGKGTGIEMSICREILRQHNGEISVRCDQKSTTFEISLPKREAA